MPNPPVGTVIREIIQDSLSRGVDPLAALAVASQEGLGGGIGDQGTSFGPFQLHYGGAYPAAAPRSSPEASQAWAESQAGIDYALNQIQGVAGGLRGASAVSAIVQGFEHPKDPAGEVSGATAAYNRYQAIQPPIVNQAGQISPGGITAVVTAGTGSAADAGSVDITGSGGGPSVVGAIKGLNPFGNLFGFLTSWRFAEVVGGFLLLIVGLILLGRQFGLSMPRTPFDRYASAQPTSREGTPRRTTSYTLEADRPAPKRAPARSAVDYGEVPF